jgi:hypothetical protein
VIPKGLVRTGLVGGFGKLQCQAKRDIEPENAMLRKGIFQSSLQRKPGKRGSTAEGDDSLFALKIPDSPRNTADINDVNYTF